MHGAKEQAYILQHISDFVVRCLVREGYTACVNYLDDFSIVGQDTAACMDVQRALLLVLGRIGVFVRFKTF